SFRHRRDSRVLARLQPVPEVGQRGRFHVEARALNSGAIEQDALQPGEEDGGRGAAAGEIDTGPLGNDLRQRRTLDLQDHAGVVGAARSPARGLPARLQLQGRWRDHQGAVPGNAYTVGPLLRREAPEAYFLRHLEALPGTLQCATDQGL